MDSEVIKEIANQLGLAVDSTAQFISEILPQYALMKVVGNGVAAAVMFIVVAVCVTIIIHFTRKEIDECKRKKEDGYYGNHYWGEASFVSVLVCSILASVLLICMACALCEAIQWAVAPNAMFLDMVLDKVK